jgi:tetratricopeptide (TPR) repeat protein
MLDADEYLDPESIDILKQIADHQPQPAVVFEVQIINNMSDGSEIHHRVSRLLGNVPGLKYVYPIHEQPVSPGMIRLSQPKIVIRHDGYLSEEVELKGKTERNRRILERAIAQDPENPFHYHNLGQTLRAAGEDDLALEALNTCIELCKEHGISPPYLSTVYARAIHALNNLSQYGEALAMAHDGVSISQNCPDFWMALGATHQGDGDIDLAVAAFKQAMSCGRNNVHYDPSSQTWKPLFAIADCYANAGKLRDAAIYYDFAQDQGAPAEIIENRLDRLQIAV